MDEELKSLLRIQNDHLRFIGHQLERLANDYHMSQKPKVRDYNSFQNDNYNTERSRYGATIYNR